MAAARSVVAADPIGAVEGLAVAVVLVLPDRSLAPHSAAAMQVAALQAGPVADQALEAEQAHSTMQVSQQEQKLAQMQEQMAHLDRCLPLAQTNPAKLRRCPPLQLVYIASYLQT